MKLAALFFGLAASLAASTVEPWLGGTRPYETVSYREMNIELLGAAAMDGASDALRLDYGILDHWMLAASWQRDDLDFGQSLGTLETRLRFAEDGAWPLDLGFYGSWEKALASSGVDRDNYSLGIVVAKELGDHSLSANADYGPTDGLEVRLGYRSPYLFLTGRAGLEFGTGDFGNTLLPQMDFNFPGDISLQLGSRLSDKGGPRFLFSLSYEIFPSP